MTRNPRRPGALAGVFYLITHVTSVGAVILYGSLLTERGWVGAGHDGTVQLVGALLDVVLAVAIIGTGVALYPTVKRYSPSGALGYVALRTAEAAVAAVGAAAVLAAVDIARNAADPAALADVGDGLIGLYRQAFTVGPGLIVGFHTMLLAWILRRHGLVAAWIPWLGLVGAPLVTLSNLLIIFGVQDQVSATASLAAVPIFAWEISLALFLIIKGLRPRPVPTEASAGASA